MSASDPTAAMRPPYVGRLYRECDGKEATNVYVDDHTYR
jgi:hypothetical protein